MSKFLYGLVLLLVSVLPSTASAQTGAVTGVVTSAATGEPLPGATVFIRTLDRGASTDVEGRYSITALPAGTYNLRITYIGFRTSQREVTVAEGATVTLNVGLEEDIFGLDDVVVIGYSQIPKREVTGSIASIRARDIEGLDVQTLDQAMQGRAAGVRVTNVSGQPGGGVHVRIRGTGSITASNEPLYIVDGIPVSNADLSTLASSNALGGVNPRDIESIEVLKDAAAASIYGAQASNGVVLITTRSGAVGRTNFTVAMSAGSVNELRRHELIEGPEWVELQRESFLWWAELTDRTPQQGLAQFQASTGIPADLDPSAQPHYDWQDALMRTGLNRRLALTANGGTEATRFYISAGYDFEEGTGIYTDFERLTLRSNIDHRASQLVALDLRVNLSSSRATGALADGFFLASPFYAGQRNRPTDPIYNEDGTFNRNTFNNFNAVEVNTLDDRIALTHHVLANGSARFNLMPNLSFRSFYGLEFRTVRDTDYRSPESSAGASLGGYLFEADRRVLNFTTNQVFNYNFNLGDEHRFTGLSGFEYRDHERRTITLAGTGFPSGLFRTMQNAADPFSVSGFGTEFKIASFFSQMKYDLRDRYLFSASARYDGSSRFGADRRWGLFYSGALAWVLSQEAFLRNANWMDDLKLRVSYGVTGNTDGISDFEARQLFGSGGAYNNQPALRPVGLGNNLLSWEGAQTINLGLDWTFFNGRMYGALDVYRRDTRDLLLSRSLPNDSGFSTLTENVGSVRNEGIELELGVVLVERGGFNWTTDFNITFPRNEVLALQDDLDYLTIADSEDIPAGLIFVGQPLGAYYMYRYAGANPADGTPMFWDRDGNITYVVSASIETGDRQIVGNSQPDYVGGWNNRFTFRGFTLDALVQFNMGQLTYDAFQGSFTDGAFWRRGGLIANSRNRWTEPGQITSVERAYVNSAYPGRSSGFIQSTRFLQDASYLRLKNVRFGYNVPPQFVQNAGFTRGRIYVQGTNLITITNYPGIDPEVVGTNNAVYPQSRIISAGIEIGF